MKSKPIYLYITPFFPSTSCWHGGFSYDAVKALMHDGRYEVVVMVTDDASEDYEYNGVKVYALKRLKLPYDCAPFLFTWINGWLLKRKLARIGIDINEVRVCHANMQPEYAYAVKCANHHAKAIWQTHWMGAPFNISIYSLNIIRGISDLLYLYWRKMLEAMDIVAVLSELQVKQFGKAYPEGPLGKEVDMREQTLFKHYRAIRPKRIAVFYNGINTRVFNPKNRGSHNGFIVGCVGNFVSTKGQLTLIKAFEDVAKSIPDSRLVLVGSGPQLAECKQAAAGLGLGERIVFEQECDHLKLADKYRSFDLFVLPTWQEGFCCVLVEAVGCGTPAMSTDAVSFREVIPEKDWDKWLVKPMDHIALSKKIIEYNSKRYSFKFNRSMDINDLWKGFLDQIEGIIC